MESGNNSGFAAIKPEFIIANHERTLTVECLSEDDKKRLAEDSNDSADSNKLQKLNNGQRRILKGQNKARPCPFTRTPETELCNSVTDLLESDPMPKCSNPKCRFMHNVQEYLKIKPASVGPTCYVYSIRGRCPWGVSCRFGAQHTTDSGRNVINSSIWEEYQGKPQPETKNSLSRDLQFKLRKKMYDFEKSEKVLSKMPKTKHTDQPRERKTEVKEEKYIEKEKKEVENIEQKNKEQISVEPEVPVKNNCSTSNSDLEDIKKEKPSGCVTDEDTISIRKEEKKKIDWAGKLYLSPLTTVGNLPFRRICRDFGVDITCGEMALATSLLQGAFQEWALVKRHSSENLFGVQLCGNNPYVMTRCAQLLQEQAVVDFVDINLGCPIELIYQQGAGSGLLRRERVLESVVRCMSEVLTVPLTVKLRTGVSSNKNIAHNLVPKFGKWGASLMTLHGRSREQRYTRLADWSYIEECAKLANPTPLFGNGDILSFEDYDNALKNHPSVAGIMIGRGALIKPWIFTEIKERRHWDISGSERFEILKKYVNYGLEHWGSDTKGVENTRRFLLEWLSFLHRYIPVGILERVPQHMNERPPFYKGRDEMETLLASSNCADWIKISEQLLGPVPEGFRFLPKHKANSWK